MAVTIFNDTFTEALDTELTLHTPDTGTGYTVLTQIGGGELKVESTSNTCTRGVGGLSDGVLYSIDATYTGVNYYVEYTVIDPDNSDDVNILAVRVQDANNMYALRFNETVFQLYKNVAGTWTALGTDKGAIVVANDVVRLDITGNTLTASVNGVTKQTETVSDHSATGKAGIGAGSIIVAGDDLSVQEYDDLSVVTTSGGATFTTDGLVLAQTDKTFTVDGQIVLKKTFTVDGITLARTDKTFTTDGLVLAQTDKTFTVDGSVSDVQQRTFTVDGIIQLTNKIKYVLDSINLPRPSDFMREQVYVKIDTDMLDGTTKRDVTTHKEKYVLVWHYLNKEEVDMIENIVSLDKAVTFEVSDGSYVINETNVLPLLTERLHNIRGSDYLTKLVLELMEVT